MIDNFIILPVLVHMLTAIIAIFFWQKVNMLRVISIAGSSVDWFSALKLFLKTQEQAF